MKTTFVFIVVKYVREYVMFYERVFEQKNKEDLNRNGVFESNK